MLIPCMLRKDFDNNFSTSFMNVELEGFTAYNHSSTLRADFSQIYELVNVFKTTLHSQTLKRKWHDDKLVIYGCTGSCDICFIQIQKLCENNNISVSSNYVRPVLGCIMLRRQTIWGVWINQWPICMCLANQNFLYIHILFCISHKKWSNMTWYHTWSHFLYSFFWNTYI